MIAAKFFDMIVGVDIHIVMVPAPPSPAPIPTPLPHPFIGIIFDPSGVIVGAAMSAGISVVMGTPFQGPVLVNYMPAANTGTEGKCIPPHFPMPPGVAWAPIPAAPKPPIPGKPPDPPTPTPTPSNDGVIVTGSKTVSFSGGNASRLGSLVMTCAEPVRLPSSAVIAVPMGAPVLIGGPPSLDLLQALLGFIKTKWVTGRLRLLTGAFEGSWRSRIICLLTGHPVDVVSGMVLTDAVDFELPGPIPFKFERTYYTRSRHKGSLGHGWHHPYDQTVTIEKKRIVYRAGDGRELYFRKIEAGESTRLKAERYRLKRTEKEILITGQDNLTHVFRSVDLAKENWLLVRIEDPRKNKIEFRYNAQSQLVEVTDSAGRIIGFTPDAKGRITAISLPHPTENGSRFPVVRFEYDEKGDLVAAFNALGHAYHYAYKYHLLVQETDRNGLSFYFAYDGITPESRCVRTWGDGGIYDHVLTYDAEKHITVKEDSSGNRTTYYGNAAGLVEKIVDSLGRTRTYEFDESLRTVAETDPNGAVTEIEYDEQGNIIKITDPDGLTRGYGYDQYNQPTREFFGKDAEFTHTYTPYGELEDSRNKLGGGVLFDYAKNGDLTSIRTRGGSSFQFSWDQSRNLTDVALANGRQMRAKYDNLGNVIHAELGEGRTIDYAHNLLGLPITVERSGIGTDRLEYDPQGNLVKTIGPGGKAVSYNIGHYNKILAIDAHEGGVRRFEYDKEGDLTAVVNEKGERFEYVRNSEGEIIREIDFSGRVTELTRDPAGRVIEITEHSGKKRKQEWTPGGRLAAIIYEDGCFDRFTYGEQGQLIEAENESGKLTQSYDEIGRVVGESWDGFSLEHRYDLDDYRIATKSSDGDNIRYEYDRGGRLLKLQVADRQEFVRDYDQSGTLKQVRLPGGILEEFKYDDNGYPAEQVVRRPDGLMISGRQFSFDAGGALGGVFDKQRGLTSYAFGEKGIETVFKDDKAVAGYQYDDAGERLPRGRPGEIGPGGRLLRFDDISYEYDEDGRVSKKTRGGRVWQYTYNDRGQMTRVVQPDGAEVSFEYDPFWRRTAKKNGSRQSRWRWNGATPFGEESSNGSKTRQKTFLFEPDGFTPLGVIADGKCLSYITDHVGTPQEVLTEDGEVAWAGDYDPWGRVERTLDGGFDNPLRFQGQYFDAETGLHYNRFRYYDPDTGRFLTPDPIGLAGGFNAYGYTNNPLTMIDPLGLSCVGRYVRSYLDFFRSGIRPRHARAIMREAMETGETYAFRNISTPGRRIGSMIAGLFGMRPKPMRVKAKSNLFGIATDAEGLHFRSDYDPAFFRNADGSVMSNSEAAAANTRLNRGMGGDEIRHPTHVTMDQARNADGTPALSNDQIQNIGPPTDSTVFNPDGSTSQMSTGDMQNADGMPWLW